MTEALTVRLGRCYTAAVHDVMRAMGLRDFVLPHEIAPLRSDSKAAATPGSPSAAINLLQARRSPPG